MDVFRTFSVLCCLSTFAILTAGCSTSPAKTASPPVKSTQESTQAARDNTAKATTPAVAVPAAKPDTAKPVILPTPRPMPAPKPAPVSKPAPKPVTVSKPTPTPAPVAKPAPVIEKPAPAEKTTPAIAAETTVALLDTTQSPKPAAETLAVSLDKMPLNIRDEWILDRNESECMLKSAPLKMDDGQGGTAVTLLIAPGNLTINTQSDIDLSYKGTGLQVDGSRQFELETIEARTNLRFNKQRQAILDSMQSGNELRLTLGFWPTWPVTHTYSVTIPLTHFATAMKAWDTCNRLLSRQ